MMVDMKRHAADVDTEDDDEVAAGTASVARTTTTVTKLESVEPLVKSENATKWFAHPGARRSRRSQRGAATSAAIKLADGKGPVTGGVVKRRVVTQNSSGSGASAMAAGGVKKHLMQRWTTTEEECQDGEDKVTTAPGKRRRPKLVHYMESGDPVPARYAPGSRLGNLIETELNTVRGIGAQRVNVKMNLRGRAKLESFFLAADGVVRAACRIAVPRLVGTSKVLGRDANTIRDALAELDNRQLRYLDALQERLRTRSSTALWGVIVGNQVEKETKEGRNEARRVSTVSRLGDAQPAYAPRLQPPK